MTLKFLRAEVLCAMCPRIASVHSCEQVCFHIYMYKEGKSKIAEGFVFSFARWLKVTLETNT